MAMLIRAGRSSHVHACRLLHACVVVCSLSVVHAASAPPAVTSERTHQIIVNSGLAGVDEDGSTTTLGEALARAGSDSADNVIVFDPNAFGVGPLTIRLTDAVCVSSARSGHDRVDGAGVQGGLTLDATTCADAGVIVGGDGTLTLSRLIVRGGRQRVVLVKQNGQLHLEDVGVTAGLGPGVAMFGKGRARLVRTRLLQNRTHGLELHAESVVELDETDVRGNGQSGLAVFDKGRITARDCRIDTNGDWNLVQTHGSQVHLERCVLQRGRFANADVSGSSSLRCEGCTFEVGRRFGIFATGQAELSLAKTVVRRHGGRGIEMQDSAGLTVSDTTVEGNGDYGIILFGHSRVEAARNVISRNDAHGVSLRDRAAGTFSECDFFGNAYSGIGCLDGADGGAVAISRCTFRQNGMRPVYRGPLHIDPVVPIPVRVQDQIVLCMTEPDAEVELFLDRAGEATRHLKTVDADRNGRFQVDCRDVPPGWVMTATATANGSTSEFNVIAGAMDRPILEALLGRTGSLSDMGGGVDREATLRRWKPGTHLVFHLPNPPSEAVERYGQFLMERIGEWTCGAVTAELQTATGLGSSSSVVIPLRYVPSDSSYLLGRGGVTFMKWDAQGFFMKPMEIILATGREARETCPRVLAHEVGHALGLCHCRVGLLSRMQGSAPPDDAYINDFSPALTFYDVVALQMLHDPRHRSVTTLGRLMDTGALPETTASVIARAKDSDLRPSFSPPAEGPQEVVPENAGPP